MRLSEKGELKLVEGIRRRFPKKSRSVLTGIGDDSAVIKADRERMLVTTDMMCEGVHFDLRFVSFHQLGFKLVSVNVSDIYAMAGRPAFALLGIAAGDIEESSLNGFFNGVSEALKLYGVSLVGGDVSSSVSGIMVSLTLIGYAHKPVLRGGARPGDRIYVTGPLGEAACGLELLKKIGRTVEIEKGRKTGKPLPWKVIEPLIKRHLMPVARKPGRIGRYATSMIDISDGLFIDLGRLAMESGVGARLYKEKIPVSENLIKAASYLGLDPFSLASGGGEDYELLFTAPKGIKVKAIFIGEVTEKGRVLVEEGGLERKIPAEGYQHFGVKGKT
jgi:thiamine-monophosphate kinase